MSRGMLFSTIFTLLATAVFVVVGLMSSILPWHLWFIVLLVVGVGLFLAIKYAWLWLHWLLTVALLVSATGMYLTQNTIDRLIDYYDSETQAISFVILKDSPIVSLENGRQLMFGYSDNFAHLEVISIEAAVQNEFNYIPLTSGYEGDFDVYEALLTGEVDVMIIDNAMWSIIAEEEEDFEDNVIIIWQVEREIVKIDIVKDVPDNEGFIVYISGIDTDGPISYRSRSDVNILMAINPHTGNIMTVSIPRDSLVPLACKNNALDKLAHAGVYGIDCSVKTIENLMGIDINYYVRVNFTSFIRIIDAIGPIQVYSQYAFTRKDYRFTKGLNTMDGDKALVFARTRKQIPGGDFTRGINQQEVIKAVFNKIISFSSIFSFEQIIQATEKSIDTNIPTDKVMELIKQQLLQSTRWDFDNGNRVLGKTGWSTTLGSGSRLRSVVFVDEQSVIDVKKQLLEITKPQE